MITFNIIKTMCCRRLKNNFSTGLNTGIVLCKDTKNKNNFKAVDQMSVVL